MKLVGGASSPTFLVAKDTAGVVLQATTLQSLNSPTPIQVGEPIEKLYFWWRPGLPDQCRDATAGTSVFYATNASSKASIPPNYLE